MGMSAGDAAAAAATTGPAPKFAFEQIAQMDDTTLAESFRQLLKD